MIGFHSERIASSARITSALLAGAMLVIVATLFLAAPESFSVVACPFRSLTGHSCFTCGMTHSLHALMHGRILASVQYHLMGPVVCAVMLLGSLRWTAEGCTGKRIRVGVRAAVRRSVIAAMLATWVLFGVIRLGAELAH